MTTRSQKRKAITELVSGEFEVSVTENHPTENTVAGTSKAARIEIENLEKLETCLRKEIMSDLTKILAENQKEMLKLLAPLNRKQPSCSNDQDSNSEPGEVSVARTSTPVKSNTATIPETTPVNSRNSMNHLLCSAMNIGDKSSICYVMASGNQSLRTAGQETCGIHRHKFILPPGR